jgi:hypothetical protein
MAKAGTFVFVRIVRYILCGSYQMMSAIIKTALKCFHISVFLRNHAMDMPSEKAASSPSIDSLWYLKVIQRICVYAYPAEAVSDIWVRNARRVPILKS